MANETLVPEAFGPLQGVRILSPGTLIAQPFAAVLAAQMGAQSGKRRRSSIAIA